MKKIIFSLTATVLLFPNSFSQSNNPHNQLGIDVVNVAHHIYKDYTEGKIKDVTQETLNYYFTTYLAKYPKIELENFNTIFDILKKSDNTSIIKNIGFSERGTAFLNKTLERYSITKLVEEVKNSTIPENEKETVLCVLAINYNLIAPYATKSTHPTSGKGPNSDINMHEIDYFQNLSHSEGLPTLIWGGIGFGIGNGICGLPCGVVGGAIGLVLGGWANDTKNTFFGSSSSGSSGSSSSGSSSGNNWGPQP